MKYDGYQRGPASMVYKCFDKKTSGGAVKKEIIQNEELAEVLQKQIIRKVEKTKVHSSFIDNNQGADLADMQLLSKFKKEIRFLLCVIDIFSKCAWVIPSKDKKVLQLLMLFKKSQMNIITNQTKYGQIKTVVFIMDQ